MRVTLLGHASVLVELDGATCLMDPVLVDPFEEGTVVSCPRRAVDVDSLPDVDILVVSHRHPDHFDLASLDLVARDVDAICPPDPLIVHALRELGFSNVHPVAVMAPILGVDFELLPTRSELASIPEMGMVFRDGSGTFWNQVDTLLSDETIDEVRDRFGTIDLLFAMYASQNFEFFESRATGFPAETHRRNLETALRIDPTVVVPASAGFRFSGDHEWLNAFLFPISRERFVADLGRFEPRVDARVVDPGDVLEVTIGGEVLLHPGASPVARTEARDTRGIAFDPTAPVPPLTDPNPDGYGPDQLERLAAGLVAGLGDWVATPGAREDRVVRAYREHRVCYRIGLVFPDGAERRFDIDFSADPPRLAEVDVAAPEADLVHRIAASALAGWAEHRRSFFSVRAYSRRFGTVYTLGRDNAQVALEARTPPDLLMYYLVYATEGSERAALTEVDQQLSQLRAAACRGSR
jgi:UDP-MurNAc hydroxylase